jgi:deazaflavin-dependent oxidoreductase (nitroreductase family)
MSSRRPSRLLRLLFRAPIMLYRVRMGWLLGGRFLLLTNMGRKTGKARRTVIEVVVRDRSVPEVAVIAAWGEHAQWVRNLKAAPAISIQIGRIKWSEPEHRFLDPTQATELMDTYRREHPYAARALARLLGWPTDTNDPGYEQFARTLCAVAFRPAQAGNPGMSRSVV